MCHSTLHELHINIINFVKKTNKMVCTDYVVIHGCAVVDLSKILLTSTEYFFLLVIYEPWPGHFKLSITLLLVVRNKCGVYSFS